MSNFCRKYDGFFVFFNFLKGEKGLWVYTRRMKETKTKCNLCDRMFQFGPGRYKGKYIEHYEMILCNPCFKTHWDGFPPGVEGQFITHMKSKEIALPERNKQGWFPR